MSRPGKAPTSGQKALSPGVWLARGKHPLPVCPKSSVPAAHRFSVASPRTGLASEKLPTRLRRRPCAPTGWYILITQVGWVSHQLQEGSPPRRTLPNIRCGLWKQAPQSTESTMKLLIRFRLPRITFRTYYTSLSTTPANYNSHIYMSMFSPDESPNSSYDNNNLHPLSPSARDKLPHVSCHRRSRHQSWREPATTRGC